MGAAEVESGIAGHLSLDFANTVEWRLSESPEDSLNELGDLLDWSESGGLVATQFARELRRSAREEPERARENFRRALLLREVIYRVFAAIAHDQSPSEEDLDLLRLFHQITMTYARLEPAESGFRWSWTGADEELAIILGPIAMAAVALLQSNELDRVGQCADDRGCGWLFLDNSRNRSRRWCSMESCGNRAKVMRHYQRSRS